jgi:hypothetical protein
MTSSAGLGRRGKLYGAVSSGASHRPFTDTSIPMHRFTAVEATVTAADDEQYFHQVRALIQDCVNQGGITNLRITDRCHCRVCSESVGETS